MTTTPFAPGWETENDPQPGAPRHRIEPVTDRLDLPSTTFLRRPYARLLPEPVPASWDQLAEQFGSPRPAPMWARPWTGWFL